MSDAALYVEYVDDEGSEVESVDEEHDSPGKDDEGRPLTESGEGGHSANNEDIRSGRNKT